MQEYFARCASGFEAVLARELRELGAKRVRPLKGGVAFFGGVEQAYRACLWSRVATRVQLVLARVSAADAEELYEGAYAFAWEKHVAEGATVAVRAHGTNTNLRNTQFTALKVKDALCDKLREVRGERPNVDAKNPDCAIDFSLHKEKATLYLNLAGDSLHRRGYRQEGVQGEAPLKETLAAGMLLAAGWGSILRAAQDEGKPAVFIDPMCGSGTLAIEAALAAADVAPGILRARWGFEGWEQHDANLWDALLDEADGRMQEGLAAAAGKVRIFASDIDAKVLELARENAKRARVDSLISFQQASAANAAEFLAEQALPEHGLVAVNPPYGQRLKPESLTAVYEEFSKVLAAVPEGWHVAVITPDATIDTALGMKPRETLACYNGPLETSVRLYSASSEARQEIEVVSLAGAQQRVNVAEPNSEQFAARLRKVARERAKWAKREGVTCYRIYDADLPDYSCAIDLYTATEGQHFVRVVEYQAPASIDAQKADRRFADTLAIVPAVLDVEPAQVFSKVRRKAKGGAQYTEARDASRAFNVQEAGYTFEVDLGGYLDTGLFLDHRTTRALVGEMAQGKRFLNLFAYTGTASVSAAGGGAAATTTVDMSQTYLDWAQRNMAANGFTGSEHTFIRADVLQWLEGEAAAKEAFDLVFCDPPTFSNSKTMGTRTFDVQRDHASLLAQIAKLLAPGGTIVFSNNLRKFKLDEAALAKAGLQAEDITAQTIPHDFARNPRIHHAFLLKPICV